MGGAGGGGDQAAGGHTGGQRHVQQGEQGPRLGLVERPAVHTVRCEGVRSAAALGLLLQLPGAEHGPPVVVAFDAAGAVQGGVRPDWTRVRASSTGPASHQDAREDLLRIGVRNGDMTGRAEPEDRLEQGVRVLLALTGGEPLSKVAQLALPAHPAPARLGDTAQQGEDRTDRGDGGVLQPLGLAVLALRKPVDDAVPPMPPVRQALGGATEETLVGLGRALDHPVDTGCGGLLDRLGEQRGVAPELGGELPHVGKERVLVGEEHLGPGVIGARQVAQHEVETGGALRHLVQHGVETAELAVHLLGVARGVGLGQRVQVAEDVGKTRRESWASSRRAPSTSSTDRYARYPAWVNWYT